MPAIPRQRRYDQVMGDRDPKVTDKRFVQELQQKLEDRYLVVQTAKEKKLAEAETRRVRKLVLDGIIEGDKRAQSDAGRDRGDDWKEFWPPNPHKTKAEYEEEKRRKAEEQRLSQQEHANGAETQRSEAPATSGDGAGGDASNEQQQQQQPSAVETTNNSGATRAAPAPIGRYEGSRSPRIDELMSEEDLDQLYTKAADIVYIMAPPPKKPAGGNKAR